MSSVENGENKYLKRIYHINDFFETGETDAPNFPTMETKILDFWNQKNIFKESLDNREGAEEFIFYDGPPFANGLPHFGHLLTGYVKDTIPRFQTMRGKLVNRRFGWDCHGLPAEIEAEKQLGIKDKAEIDAMGLAKFNEFCRSSVLKYTQEWREYVNRQGRWVDMDNDYMTMDLDYMESVMWAFKELYKKGLIYQGYRVVPYSWFEQTSLSNQETRLDDAYRMRQDPALTVAFPITEKRSKLNGVNLLVWTTTPWTLPSNLAAAVNPEFTYVVVKKGKAKYLLAEQRLAAYAKELGENPEVMASYKGKELEGLSYNPPFSFFKDWPNAHQILLADFVTLDSGTGVVHLAPAFGEDDMEVAKAYGIQVVQPLDAAGKFTDMAPPYAGLQVFDANPVIIKDLKKQGLVIRHETIEHSYPHSWRSGKPLIYMAIPAWFVSVSKFRDNLTKNNQDINWIPDHIKDGQFGKWLAGAKDWNISRSRYWGSPIPVWVSDNEEYPRVDVYGSLDELEKDFGVRPTDLHRPYIDELVRPNPDDPTGKSMMRRVTDVLDGWFDSGSMPYAQLHYPFENKNKFEQNFPGDFIVEYIAQTRGWFYNMHVLSTALFDKAAFLNVLAHGVVLADDGQKMSKSKRNYVDVNEVFDKYGSDAMRWFLLSSTILTGGNIVVNESGIKDGIRQAILPLWNSFSFLRLYADRPAKWNVDSEDILDQYIFSKLAECINDITESLEKIDIPKATIVLRDFLEVLTNWYIRRSRNRFWEGQDKHPEAFNTLYTVLEITTRIAAPLLPFTCEAIWKGLTGGKSVHITDWPTRHLVNYDANLAEEMDIVRDVCSVTSSIRKKHNLRVRLPLAKLTIAHPEAEKLKKYAQLIKEETNVKEIVFSDSLSDYASNDLQVNARVLGPRIGGKVQEVIKAVKQGNWSEDMLGEEKVITVLDETLKPDEYILSLKTESPDTTSLLNTGKGLVILDIETTPELELEGWVKDRVREFQQARKDNNFDVSDRITVKVWVPTDKVEWINQQKEFIMSEILATELELVSDNSGMTELSPDFYASLQKV